jgi:hypothetical protein
VAEPAGEPERVGVHDFPDAEVGKAIPYGVYDLGANTGWVSVGTDHDTAAFAVATLRRWWEQVGRVAYPRPSGCWSPPTPVAATATGHGCGRPSWPGSRPRRAFR